MLFARGHGWPTNSFATQIIRLLGMFGQIRSRYREGAAMMARAVEPLSQYDTEGTYADALATALIEPGFFQIRLGQLDHAQESFG